MKAGHYLALALLLTSASCNFRSQDPIVTYDTIPSTEEITLNKIIQPHMTFYGTLPCADCGGIKTELTFIPDSMIYRMRETYLNTGMGDKQYESTGPYAINVGTAEDSGASVYQLNPGDTERIRSFRTENDTIIVMLDRHLHEIKSTLSYKLVRVRDSI